MENDASNRSVAANCISGVLKVLSSENPRVFLEIASRIASSRKTPPAVYRYEADGTDWTVLDADEWKLTVNDRADYHCFFDKRTGFNCRFGARAEDDPAYCGLGPEILDLEVSVNGCVPVPGSTNCRYCYKNNTNAAPTNMSFDTFKRIVDSFPKNLSQIAFGITGIKTNPDLEKMFAYCRAVGIVPNVTTVGADMDNNAENMLCRWCGAVAVSCYTGAKDLCYQTIKKLHDRAETDYGRDLHVNMHIVVSEDNMPHLREVLRDIADKKVDGLKSVVLLRIKPKGRAAKMNCRVSKETYSELVKFCLDNKISFGFDSCSAVPVMEVLKELGRPELCSCCEPCESSKLSSYINVKGEYWSCSFAEGTNFIKPVNVLEHASAIEWWNGDEVKKARFCENPACGSCPIYELD